MSLTVRLFKFLVVATLATVLPYQAIASSQVASDSFSNTSLDAKKGPFNSCDPFKTGGGHKGHKGHKGDTGPTGATGSMGPMGFTGPTGPAGATGATGDTGSAATAGIPDFLGAIAIITQTFTGGAVVGTTIPVMFNAFYAQKGTDIEQISSTVFTLAAGCYHVTFAADNSGAGAALATSTTYRFEVNGALAQPLTGAPLRTGTSILDGYVTAPVDGTTLSVVVNGLPTASTFMLNAATIAIDSMGGCTNP